MAHKMTIGKVNEWDNKILFSIFIFIDLNDTLIDSKLNIYKSFLVIDGFEAWAKKNLPNNHSASTKYKSRNHVKLYQETANASWGYTWHYKNVGSNLWTLGKANHQESMLWI